MPAKNNSGLVRAKCADDQGELTVLERPADERFDLYLDLDRLLWSVTGGKFHFLSELNDLQSNDDGDTVFANKADIPLRIVNLVLAPYNIIIEED